MKLTAYSPNVPETLFKESVSILNTAAHDARMNEIEVVRRKRSRFLDIVNLEL